jgi:hypothetical protein
MPIPTIGGVQFTSWAGRMPYPQVELGVLEAMAGIDDDAILTAALKCKLAAITVGVTIPGNQVTGEQFAQNLRAMADGVSTFTIYDNMGVVWNNVVVMSVQAYPTLLATGTQVRVDASFLFKIPVSNNAP